MALLPTKSLSIIANLSLDFLAIGAPYILAGLYFLGAAAGVGLAGRGRLIPAVKTQKYNINWIKLNKFLFYVIQ